MYKQKGLFAVFFIQLISLNLYGMQKALPQKIDTSLEHQVDLEMGLPQETTESKYENERRILLNEHRSQNNNAGHGSVINEDQQKKSEAQRPTASSDEKASADAKADAQRTATTQAARAEDQKQSDEKAQSYETLAYQNGTMPYRNQALQAADAATNKKLPTAILDLIGDYLDFQKYQETHTIIETPCRLVYRFKHEINSITRLTNGNLVSCSENGTLQIWNQGTWQHVRTLTGHTGGVTSVIELANGNLASGSKDNTIKIWDPNTGGCLHTLIGHAWVLVNEYGQKVSKAYIEVVQLTSGDIASYSMDGTIRIWDPNIGVWLLTLTGHSDSVNKVLELTNGSLASCSDDKTIKIWDLANGQCVRTLRGHGGFLRPGAVKTFIELSNGNIASCSTDKTAKIWDPTTGACLQTFSGHGDKSLFARVNHVIELGGGRLATGSNDSTVKIWDIATGNCIYTFSHGGPLAYGGILAKGFITHLQLLNDGRLASSSYDRTIKIWNLETGTLEQTLSTHKQAVRGFIELPQDGIASCANDGTIRIWRATPALDSSRSAEEIHGPAYYKQYPKRTAFMGAGTSWLLYKLWRKKYGNSY
jgi:WD40 repeat protein